MRHPTRWVASTIAVVVVAFGVVLATQVSSDPRRDDSESGLLGDAVPTFSVRGLDGTKITAADLAGRSVIVNFWNTWCIPCREELPALKDFYAAHAGDSDFLMLGIVRDDSEQAVRDYVDAEGLEWTIAFDPGSEAALAFGTRGQPETFAVNPDGTVVGVQIGPSSVDDLEEMLAAARERVR